MPRYKVTRYDYDDAGDPVTRTHTYDAFNARIEPNGALVFSDQFGKLTYALSPERWDKVKSIDIAE